MKKITHESEFNDLFGIWSKEEKKEFDIQIEDLYEVDTKDWEPGNH